MTTLLKRLATALRVWLGLADPSENLTPAHGWLLPDPEMLMNFRSPAPVAAVAGRFKA